jgi:hypothetical protein
MMKARQLKFYLFNRLVSGSGHTKRASRLRRSQSQTLKSPLPQKFSLWHLRSELLAMLRSLSESTRTDEKFKTITV